MSVAVLYLPILILLALAIGALVYFLCYKAAINRKLRGEESGAHVPMASMETVWKVVAVIAVFVMYSSLSSKITNLQNELNHVRSNLSNEINEVEYKLYQMQEEAKKEASMISETSFSFGTVNPEEHTVEMTFSVVPKSYSPETKLTLNYRGETIVLTNSGSGVFTGSTRVPIFGNEYGEGENGLFCVTEDGVTKTEAWEEVPKQMLYYECLPVVEIWDYNLSLEKEKDGVRFNGQLKIGMYDNKKGETVTGAITMYVKKENEVIDEIVSENGVFSFDRSYPVKKGEDLTVYAKGMDEYGYIHEMFVTGWSTGEASADVAYEFFVSDDNQIYAPDGTAMIQEENY